MQPRAELRIHPVDLREFGSTPSGEDVYRVVWADTRQSVAFRGEDRIVTPKYQHGAESELQGKWVLEKWLPASMYYGMTAEKWDSLQRTAPEQRKPTTEQDREIDRFLSSLPKDMRTQVESQFSQPTRVPVIEPYSHDGEYEFAGLYFATNVDEAFLKTQIRGHIYRTTHTTDAERTEEAKAAEVKQEEENDQKFDTLFEETREAAMA